MGIELNGQRRRSRRALVVGIGFFWYLREFLVSSPQNTRLAGRSLTALITTWTVSQ
jgi:hypothetical protein